MSTILQERQPGDLSPGIQSMKNSKLNQTADFRFTVTAARWALPGAPVLLRYDTFEKQFAAAAELGYDALEMHLRTPEDAPVSELQALQDRYGVKVSGVATGLSKLVDGLSFIDPDAAVRRKATDRIRGFIDWASPLGAYIVIGSMRGNLPAGDERFESLKRMRECMTELVAYAEEKDVTLLLEVINRYENNYLNTAAETIEYVGSYNSDHLKTHLDLFHMNIEEADMLGAIRAVGKDLGLIHFADNNRRACGEGAFDFTPILGTLAEVGYTGYLSLEHNCIPDGYTAAKHSIDFLRSLLP